MNILQNLSKIKQINKIELLRDEISKFRPLSREQEDRIMQKFRLDWNYHSTVIEGNSLNFGETIAFLRHGLTAKGKPLKDHLDIRGHNNAINILVDLVKGNRQLIENDIRELHEIILVEPYEIDAITSDGHKTRKIIKLGQYKTEANHVKTITGEIHYYASPEETPAKMDDLMDWFEKTSNDKTIHPLVFAAVFHHKFVEIHPFDDGNGRMARILLNYVLMKNHYPPVVIRSDKKNEYYAALSQADAGYYDEFVILLAENLIHSLEIYLKGAKGESIDEPDDLDKELNLFEQEIKGKEDKIEQRKTLETKKIVYQDSIKPLLEKIFKKLEKFDKFFFNSYYQTIFFTRKNILEPLQYYFDDKMNQNEFIVDLKLNKNDEVFIVKKFEEFKNEGNPFGIELKIIIKFEKFRYKISYYFSKIDELKYKDSEYFIVINKLKVNNYYHQHLSKTEIDDCANLIGHDLLVHIKKIEKNKNYFDNNISEKQVMALKKGFTKKHEKYIKFNENSLAFNPKNNTFITDSEISYIEKEDFLKYVNSKINLKSNIGFLYDNEYFLPF